MADYISKRQGIQPAVKDEMLLRDKAASGDIVFVVSPSTVSTSPTAAAWTRTVGVEVQTAAGEVHNWYSKAITTGVSIAATSNAGTATIPSTTLTFDEGKASVVVSGDAAAWLGGIAQVETITCTKGTGIQQVETITCTTAATNAGNITLAITSAGMTNSPKDVVVAVLTTDNTVTKVAEKCVIALNLDADVSSKFVASNVAGAVKLTAISPATNDATLAFGFTDTGTTLVEFGASTDTTAGVAGAAGDVTMTITSAGMTNSPKAVVVAVAATDFTVTQIGDLMTEALNDDVDVSAKFVASNIAGAVKLTAIVPAANDATLAFGYVDTDTTGVTFGASTDTTAGVAKETDTLTVAQATILGYTIAAKTSVETFEA